jgi:hypothetical protein
LPYIRELERYFLECSKILSWGTVCEVKRKILLAGKKLSFLNNSGIIEEEEKEEQIDIRSIF